MKVPDSGALNRNRRSGCRVRQRMVYRLPFAVISKRRLPSSFQTRSIFSMSYSLQVFIFGCFRSQRRAVDLKASPSVSRRSVWLAR